MPIAKVGDINLYYEVHGKGEPLVLIMGFGQRGGHWFSVQDILAKEYRAIIIDNRGTGQSDKPEMPYTAKMMAADVVGLLDVLGIKSANVFGVSLGGMIAQEFALNYPDRLNSLILGCTFCGGARAISPTPEALAFLLDPTKRSAEEAARIAIPWIWNKEFAANNPTVIERYVAISCEYPTPKKAFASQSNVAMTLDTFDRLPNIKSPTLVITGIEDRIMPYENSKILADRIPYAQLVIIDNAGHCFFTDSVEKASKIILNFLRRHSKAHARK